VDNGRQEHDAQNHDNHDNHDNHSTANDHNDHKSANNHSAIDDDTAKCVNVHRQLEVRWHHHIERC